MIPDIALLLCALLIFLLCQEATGTSDFRWEFYTANSTLNGFQCTNELAVEIENDFVAESDVQCSHKCSRYCECMGFYFTSDTPTSTCLLCNHLFHPESTDSLDELVGSKYYNKDCYGCVHGIKHLRVFLDRLDHNDAQARCEETGGTLARIRNLEELLQIQDTLTSSSCYNTEYNYWTDGLADPDIGTMTFSDGTPMPENQTYWQFLPFEDGVLDGPCERLRLAANTYRWNDEFCNREFSFVCEYE